MSFNFYRFWVLTLLFVSCSGFAAYDSSDVKAVYIFRIANFIHWDSESEMLNIEFCVVGNDKIATTLDKIIQNKTVRQLPLVVRSSFREECDIVYIDKIHSTDEWPVAPYRVVMSDSTNTGERGGTVELATIEGKVKPKIYLRNIGRFAVSANLLSIAIVIEGKK